LNKTLFYIFFLIERADEIIGYLFKMSQFNNKQLKVSEIKANC